MQQQFRETHKLHSCLSESLQISVSINSQTHQAQVTLTRQQPNNQQTELPDLIRRIAKRTSSDSYSAARTPPFYAITLSPEEFDSLRYFLPVFDNFYQYYLYVYNKPSSIGKPYFRSTTDQSSAKARASNN